MTTNQTQGEKFRQAARELECDEDEAKWDDSLKRIVKQKDAPKRGDNDA